MVDSNAKRNKESRSGLLLSDDDEENHTEMSLSEMDEEKVQMKRQDI